MKLNEKMREPAEVAFSEIFSMTANAISALSFSSEENRVPGGLKKFSMKALRNAAAAGVASASLSDLVEDLLAHPNIPSLPRPHNASSDNALIKYFNIDFTLAILVDLACTSCSNWDLCNNMFEIIKAKRKQSPEFIARSDSSRPEDVSNLLVSPLEKRKKSVSGLSGLKGVNAFFRQLDGLLQLGFDDIEKWPGSEFASASSVAPGSPRGSLLAVSPFTFMNPPASPQPFLSRQSLLWHLRSAAPPLTALALRQFEGTVVEIRQAFEQANQALAASSYLNRQESINIDEHHFSATPRTPASHSPAQSSQSSSQGSAASARSKESTTGRLDAPILHVRIKQLIGVMEKVIPSGGFYRLLMR